MEQRISLVTLGVTDLERSRRFYEALGWTTDAEQGADIVFFQAGGLVIALWGRAELAVDSAVDDPGGYAGITLAHIVRSPEEVDRARRRDDRACRRRDVLGRLLGHLSRPGRPPMGGCPQPVLDARGRRLDAPLGD